MGYQYTSKLPFCWEYEFQTLDLGKHQNRFFPMVRGWIRHQQLKRLVSMFLLGWRWRNYPKLCVDPIKTPDYIFSVNLFQGIPWFDVPQWDTSVQKRLCASTSTYRGCPCNHAIIFIRNKPSLESMLFGGIQIAVRKLHRTGSTLADMEASWQSGYPVVIWSDVLENLRSYLKNVHMIIYYSVELRWIKIPHDCSFTECHSFGVTKCPLQLPSHKRKQFQKIYIYFYFGNSFVWPGIL